MFFRVTKLMLEIASIVTIGTMKTVKTFFFTFPALNSITMNKKLKHSNSYMITYKMTTQDSAYCETDQNYEKSIFFNFFHRLSCWNWKLVFQKDKKTKILKFIHDSYFVVIRYEFECFSFFVILIVIQRRKCEKKHFLKKH